jgi:putative MFS transporter
MTASIDNDLLRAADGARLTSRYWGTMALLAFQTMFEFFDFYLVGFLVAVLAPQWHLTFGQSAIMLLSAGVGAIVGALTCGKLADSWGRKRVIVLGAFVYSLSAGAIALIPNDAWIFFSALRFLVGFGMGGALTSQLALIVEYTPTRHRTVISGAMLIPVSFGPLLASLTAAAVLGLIGWRGLAALGAVPVLAGVGLAFVAPESLRWMLANGRLGEARATAAKILGVSPDALLLPAATQTVAQSGRFRDLWDDQRRFWLTVIPWLGIATTVYGVLLWGPAIVALVLGVAPKEAARLFIVVNCGDILGRVIFSLLPTRIGRRRCGELMGYGGAVFLILAGLLHAQFIGNAPVFLIALALGATFFGGGFANIGPYSAELYPVRLAARAVGLAQAANGIGKIAGAACLALIAGTGNFVTPQATAAAVMPAFIFLGCSAFIAGLTFTILPIETHGKELALTVPPRPVTAGR